MSVPSKPNEESSVPELFRAYSSIVEQVYDYRPGTVRMLLEGEQLAVSFLSADSIELHRSEFPEVSAGQFSSWLSFLIDRAYFWPEFDDALFGASSGVKRLLFASGHQEAALSDFHVIRKSGKSVSEIQLLNFRFRDAAPINQRLHFSKSNEAMFQRLSSCESGIVLTNASAKPHTIDATAVLLASHPSAWVVRHCTSEKVASLAIEHAKTQLVVVAMQNEDPVEMIAQFFGLLSNQPELRPRFTELLRGSFIHQRIRRVCASCARSTPVDSRTIDKVPTLLRGSLQSSYLFGRGCELCGHSAYRGTIGLSSMVVADKGFKEILGTSPKPAHLALDAYNSGTRTLFEDGIEKIFAGLASFEEVFSATNNISAAFAGAIAAFRDGAQGGAIESIESDRFQGAAEKRDPAKRRVLIVEDDNDQRNVLESVFRTEGFEVFGAENGQAALESLESHSVDIVICDVMMPVMNGAQFVKELRGTARLKHVPVLMLTAVSNPDAECKLLAHGADDYCEKNVKRKVLLTRVEKLLQRNNNPLNHMLRS